MEKAMRSAHGVGYEDYKRHHAVRMRVEQRRKKDYKTGCRMAAELDRLIHFNNRLKA
jgi:hypothetical protein